jgi:hypothetical protein
MNQVNYIIYSIEQHLCSHTTIRIRSLHYYCDDSAALGCILQHHFNDKPNKWFEDALSSAPYLNTRDRVKLYLILNKQYKLSSYAGQERLKVNGKLIGTKVQCVREVEKGLVFN